jgi:hypothetical protein
VYTLGEVARLIAAACGIVLQPEGGPNLHSTPDLGPSPIVMRLAPELAGALDAIIAGREGDPAAEARARSAKAAIGLDLSKIVLPTPEQWRVKYGRRYTGGRDACVQNMPNDLRCYCYAPSHTAFIAADASNLHLRLVARLSGDDALAAFVALGDPYMEIVRRFGVSRKDAKRAVSGLLNGGRSRMLMDECGFSPLQADRFLSWFEARFLDAWCWMAARVQQAKDTGTVTLHDGRKVAVKRSGQDAIHAILATLEGEMLGRVIARAQAEIIGCRIAIPMHDGALFVVPAGTEEAAARQLHAIMGTEFGGPCTAGFGATWHDAESKNLTSVGEGAQAAK